MGETAEEAVIREVYKETGVAYEIDRLLFIHENFFSDEVMHKDISCHEIAFYFLMKQRGSKEINSFSYCQEGKEFMHWIPIADLKNLRAYPEFFAEKLRNMPDKMEHIVTKE